MSIKRLFSFLVLSVVLVPCVLAASASAEGCTTATCKPWWRLATNVSPANIAPHGEGTLLVKAVNAGDAETTGALTLIDTLPPGVSVLEENGVPAIGFFFFGDVEGSANNSSLCTVVGRVVSCTLPEGEYPYALAPYEDFEMRVRVKVGGATEEEQAEVSGGGAAPVQRHRPIPVGAGSPPFGVEQLEQVPEEADGSVDARAGSHPFQLSTTLNLNQTGNPAAPPAMPKDLQFDLPAGLVGNATAVPRCSEADFHNILNFQNFCPVDAAVGVVSVTFDEPIHTGLVTYPLPLFNLVTAPGEPARFGFTVIKTPVVLDTGVRTGENYGVKVSVSNISQTVNFISTTATFWGVPSDERHHASRGAACLAKEIFNVLHEACLTNPQPSLTPFLTLPTSCATPFVNSVEGDSWPFKASPAAEPRSLLLAARPQNETVLRDQFGRELGMTGCNQLPFDPLIEAAPDVQSASSSSGLTVHVRVPQEVSENGEGLASSSVKDITVELPEGVQVNPSGGNNLEACSDAQIGFQGEHEYDPGNEKGNETYLFSPILPEPLSPGLELGAKGFCPDAAKIGTVKISSPLIANPVEGSVYLASQNQNPFGSLLAMYIVAEDPVSGTLVKLPGRVYLCKGAGEVLAGMTCGVAGQLVTTFQNEPQLPFEDAELKFFGGERAPLATPAHCGTYTTKAAFVPWSAEAWDLAAQTKTAESTFQITSGPNGAPCPGAKLPFAPGLTSGTLNANAGSFSALTTTIGREDGEQNMSQVTLHFPPGLSGLLSNVVLCAEQAANDGKCPESSLIGETTVSAGVGNDPVAVKGGKVYITEKYHGAPFGLSIVNPVKAGPFDLEHDTSPDDPGYAPACDCLVVRARIEVDPLTAALTVTTNRESEGYAIPHLIDGVPVQIKKVNVTVGADNNFTFNPTTCNGQKIEGSIGGVEGGNSLVSVPFQTANCKNLAFKPRFEVSTSGKTSRKIGASLHVALSYPKGSMGDQANVHYVKVDLPKQLPSNLKTLQKACPAKTFETNPAGCDPESKVGTVLVHTQVLPVPLTGPAYFVSHGGAKFPELVFVLQGYGVTVQVHAETYIDEHTNVTSSTIRSAPDVPFETFELTLPQGPYSALAAPGGLCNITKTAFVNKRIKLRSKGHTRTVTRRVRSQVPASLVMPTAFTAQNGAEIHQNTPIEVTGCGKTKAKKASKPRHLASRRR